MINNRYLSRRYSYYSLDLHLYNDVRFIESFSIVLMIFECFFIAFLSGRPIGVVSRWPTVMFSLSIPIIYLYYHFSDCPISSRRDRDSAIFDVPRIIRFIVIYHDIDMLIAALEDNKRSDSKLFTCFLTSFLHHNWLAASYPINTQFLFILLYAN